MIRTKKELIAVLKKERSLYIDGNKIRELKLKLLKDSEYLIWHYQMLLRKTEYHYNCNHKIRYYFYQRRKNIEGARLGISIFHNSVDCGLRIYHYGNIVINSNCKIGKNLKLHGSNCIGNKGDKFPIDVPVIEDDVELGFGAVVIGKIRVSQGTIVSANSVVNKSISDEGTVVGGIPAHYLKQVEI